MPWPAPPVACFQVWNYDPISRGLKQIEFISGLKISKLISLEL